jgi:PAS domain-containing protein
VYLGTVVEAGSAPVPEEWKRLDISDRLFQTVLDRQGPVVANLEEGSGVSMIGPLAGMRSAVWLPLRIHGRTLGLALVAYARPYRALHTETLQTLADELALAVAGQRDRELSRLRRAELASRGQLQRAILRGAPADKILPETAREAARYSRAEFVALGRKAAGRMRFDDFEGPREWIPWIQEEPYSGVWGTALEEGRRVSVDLRGLETCRPRGDLFGSERVSWAVAIPLEVRGARLGVLLAGLASAAEPIEEFESLESYAALAAAALWEEHHRALLADAETSFRALLESSGEWILILDREGVIREANRAALEHLVMEPARLGRVRLEELF